MGRRVKCQITGNYGDSDIFYKAENGKYYTSREVYEYDKKQKQYRKKLLDTICFDFLGYKEGQPFNTLLTKKLKELEFYSYEVINQTIEEQRDTIEYYLRIKNFANESAKISYIMAIVRNNINDVHKRILEEERKQERVNKATYEIDNVDLLSQYPHKEKDIRKWLGDEDF